MRPAAAANQLSRVWRQVCPNDDPYPVDARLLAEEVLNIRVHSESIDDNFEAQLVIRRKKRGQRVRAIIYNANIREEGRKNFSICHEIGHNSCHVNQEELFCTADDLNDAAPHPESIEQEANTFAATLLMPADDFRVQMRARPVTLETISLLANDRYNTSLTASCTRLLHLHPRAYYGMAIVKDGIVRRWDRSDSMKYTGFGFRRGHRLPTAIAHDPTGTLVDSNIWLNERNAPRWELSQSAVYMPYYNQMLVLIAADRSVVLDEYEEPDPTPPRIPTF